MPHSEKIRCRKTNLWKHRNKNSLPKRYYQYYHHLTQTKQNNGVFFLKTRITRKDGKYKYLSTKINRKKSYGHWLGNKAFSFLTSDNLCQLPLENFFRKASSWKIHEMVRQSLLKLEEADKVVGDCLGIPRKHRKVAQRKGYHHLNLTVCKRRFPASVAQCQRFLESVPLPSTNRHSYLLS